MEYVDCVVLGNKNIGKHTLVGGFHDNTTREDEVSLSLTIDRKKVDFVVKLVDENMDNKKRRLMYLKADVVIAGYSTIDMESFQSLKKVWMPELQVNAPAVPVLLIGTKFDRVPEDLQGRVRERGDKTAKEFGCIGFLSTSSLSSINTELFERAVQAGLAKKRAIQKQVEEKKPRKRLQFALFGHRVGCCLGQTSASDLQPGQDDNVIQSVARVATISASTIDYTYNWRGELICSLVEDLLDGRMDYTYSDLDRDMTVPFDLDTTERAVGEVIKKLLIFYHFLPVVQNSLEMHNMQFWIDVEDFKYNKDLNSKKIGRSKRLKREAVRIYQDFIMPNSPKEINIEDDVRNDITIRLNNVSNSRVFDLAQIHVLNQLAVLFKEHYVETHTVKALMSMLKSFAKFIPRIVVDREIDTVPSPTGDGLNQMLSRCIHVMTLMEMLHSSTSSEKRPPVTQFLKMDGDDRIVKLALRHLSLFAALKTHIDKEKSLENLLFWLDAEDFRSLDFGPPRENDPAHDAHMKKLLSTRATHIVRRYVEDDAEFLINLPGLLSKQIKLSLVELQDLARTPHSKKSDESLAKLQHMFDGAQREILLLIKRDSWRRFQTSQEAFDTKRLMDRLSIIDEFEDPERARAESRLHNRFDLMSDERLLRSFTCALEKKMLLHGELFVTKRHICFFSAVFGFKTKLCYNFSDIVSVTKEEQDLVVRKRGPSNTAALGQALILKTADGTTLVFKQILPSRSLLMYVLKKTRQRLEKGGHEDIPSSMHTVVGDADDAEDEDNTQGMTDKDWELFKEGAEILDFKSREIVLAEGMPAGSVYQIARGTVKIEKNTPSGVVVLRTCKEGEIIGEVSFVEGGSTSAAVVADSDDVVVYSMTRDFVERALVSTPGLSGRFFKFLATLLAERLRTKKVLADANSGGGSGTLSDVQFRAIFGLKDDDASILDSWEGAFRDTALLMYGRIYLSQSVLCFYAKVLGSVKKQIIPLSDISHVTSQKGTLAIVQRSISSKCEFHQVENCERARQAIQSQISQAHRLGVSYLGTLVDSDDLINWSMFLSGAELKMYHKDEPILEEGTSTRFVYQIGHGGARVQKKTDGVVQVFRNMLPGEIFGEMSFLQDFPASASIVAAQEHTMVYNIEKKFVDSLLELNPELPGRFYKFLAASLASRLRD